jgi:four helix bundle protein
MQDFKKLDVWKKAHRLTMELYQVTANFPTFELYGLTSQMPRAAASIGANICEGCGRSGDPDFARYLQHAFSSACELEYHLILPADLVYLSKDTHDHLAAELESVKRMLASLLKKLRADSR